MELNDKELRQQLSQGPLSKNGFDERLIQRIEDALDHPPHKVSIFAKLGWHGAGLAAFAVLLLVFGIWQWTGSPSPSTEQMNLTEAAQQPNQDVKLFADPNASLNSVLLLGLRSDHQTDSGNIISNYRTILIAPDNQGFQIAAEGDGIVMPYLKDFWKIDSVDSRAGDIESQRLAAYKVTGKGAQKSATLETKSVSVLDERLLYVGNEYLSLVQNRTTAPNSQFRFVKTIEQLATPTDRSSYEPSSELHVGMEETLGDDKQTAPAEGKPTEQWSIIRHTGSWTAAAAETPPADAYAPFDNASLRELTTPLPKKVDKSDKLALTWTQILKLVPGAKDAYTSPTNDMLAVVTDEEILFYPYQMVSGDANPLSIRLVDSNETVIMAQWAQGTYVDTWKTQVSSILNPVK